MTASVVHKHLLLWFRPSRMLGLLFFAVPCAFLGMMSWVHFFPDRLFLWFVPAPLSMDRQNWLFVFGVVSAIEGWIVSSYMTLRNSIKQHTINTLLQSRLSTQYMSQAKIINENFFAPGMPKNIPVPLDELLDSEPARREALGAVNYVLNYFEFLAVAIRHGDLDEELMKNTMKGIVLRLCGRMSLYIASTREEFNGKPSQPTTQFEHIVWLINRWGKK